MERPELLAPAGSMEGVRAAVQSGADAVYMGFGMFNARRGAKNFSREEMAEAIRYCRARGVKTHITLNVLVTDRELVEAMRDVRFLSDAGADALIVQDIGLASRIHACVPDLPLHASTQMTVQTLEGALFAKSQGFSRVVLARECTLAQIRRITAESGMETEVFVHGALCMCYSGQCYLSAVIGRRSGNRGLCAQPCRLPYRYDNGKSGYPLSLKDLCLAGQLRALQETGVASLKIEGRMKRPEYTAIVTEIYASLLREQRAPRQEELDTLRRVFSRDGFTDGYLTGKTGDRMFGTKDEIPLSEVRSLYDEAARRFAPGKEAPLVGVDLCFSAGFAQGATLTAQAVDRSDCTGVASVPAEQLQRAERRPASEEQVRHALCKTGGTPFSPRRVNITLADENLLLPNALLNGLRREALQSLQGALEASPHRPFVAAPADGETPERAAFCGYTLEVRQIAQLSDDMLQRPPHTVYVPLGELAEHPQRVTALQKQGLPLAAVLPRIATDDEWERELTAQLQQVQALGVSAALAGNLGQLSRLRQLGFVAYGDFGLNAMNSDTLRVLREAGVKRQTASFELRLAQVRDLHPYIDIELLIYGYLPLMLFENCVIRRKTSACTCKKAPCRLTDRRGKSFAVLPAYGCRNELLNSQPLYLENRADYRSCGAAFARVRFTTESPARCSAVWRAITQDETLEIPEGATRGLAYRGVE